MVYDIVTDPNPMLHRPSATVSPSEIKSRGMQKFIKDMVETMYVKDGVGLAAVQVGRPIMLCVIIKKFTPDQKDDLCLINPTWKKLSLTKIADEEGCLSVPGMYGQMKRYAKIKVNALDKNGNPIEFIAEDFFSRIVQHEIDHLNGHLYIEKATKLRRADKALL
ncbi:MAG: peptide deformylase [Patescibacteria group bacterium]